MPSNNRTMASKLKKYPEHICEEKVAAQARCHAPYFSDEEYKQMGLTSSGYPKLAN